MLNRKIKRFVINILMLHAMLTTVSCGLYWDTELTLRMKVALVFMISSMWSSQLTLLFVLFWFLVGYGGDYCEEEEVG